jgi:glycosyltransferase involved in cell wall biosynthesis
VRIAYDFQTFELQRYGGISRYFVRLAEQMLALDMEVGVFAPFHLNQYVKELPYGVVHGRQVGGFPGKLRRVASFVNRVVAREQMRQWRPDVVHETYFSSVPTSVRGPRVVTVYDMIHEILPNRDGPVDPTIQRKKIAVQRADHVICISENTRKDLLERINVDPDKVTVVYLGFDKLPIQSVSADSVPSVKKPFLLYVGNRDGHKNFSGFLRAFASSSRLCKDFSVVAFGGSVFSDTEKALIQLLGFETEQIIHIAGDDAVLGNLYEHAACFVYPSLYEGFGLPPLEAMAHGCPVVSSNASSMPEVVGDAGEYFSPTSPDEMAQAIERVVYSSARIDELVNLGRGRLEVFAWHECAKRTLEIYRRLGGRCS